MKLVTVVLNWYEKCPHLQMFQRRTEDREDTEAIQRSLSTDTEMLAGHLGTQQEIDINYDCQLPTTVQIKINEKLKTVSLNLPARGILVILANTSTVTKISTQHELKLVSTLLKAGGADINSTNLNV